MIGFAITIIIGQYILIGGLIYLFYYHSEKQDKRIDTLLKYIKPDAYHKIKNAERLAKIEIPFPNEKHEPTGSFVDKFLST